MKNAQKGSISTGLLVVIALALVAGLGGIGACSVVLGARSQCISAESGLKAQLGDNENVYDNTWKDIKEEAQVTDQFVAANKDLLRSAVEGRKGGAGELVRLIHEANPTLDPQVFLKVQRSIEAAHAKFGANQTALLDRKREYENLYQSPTVMFANVFLSPPFPRVKMEDFKIVTSDETEKAFGTGKAPALRVFDK